MFRFALVLFLGLAPAWPQSISVPGTPAGQVLQAWLDAFNSGDRGRIQSYIDKHDPERSADETLAFRSQTGGFDLLAIDISQKLEIAFRVKEKSSSTHALGRLEVKDTQPAKVASFSLRGIPPGLTAAEMTMKMDAVARARVLDGIVARLNEHYVFPDTAKKMEAHLNDIYNRKEDSTTQYWTPPFVAGKRLADKPVFVLTSRRTFSGAEEFSYNLKNLKRATIIGETTGGGAHPVSGQRIDDHFMIGVPFARAVNPVSKTNWEGTGVEPDVKVPADQALDVAIRMAGEQTRGNQRP